MIALHLLIAVVLHEFAHGKVAELCGDSTARRAGRLTLNPIKHIDPFLTIILPALLLLSGSPLVFGGAKPVPVNFNALRHPRRDSVLVAAAGPMTNFTIALFLGLVLRAIGTDGPEWLILSLLNGMALNVGLACFNLIPIPPLDGGRIAVGCLPRPLGLALSRVERYGFLIVIALLYLHVVDDVITSFIQGFLKLILG